MTSLRERAFRGLGGVQKIGIVEFAEKHCGYKLYPRQRVLLKLIWLEEMDDYEESVLDEWIEGKRGVRISPKIRERRQALRERGYDHFSEIGLILGRRASKGFITGISAAYKLYLVQQLGDPGDIYGIAPTKEIYFTCVAVALHQSRDLQFADFVNSVTSCDLLQQHVYAVNEESFKVRTESDEKYAAMLEERGVKNSRDFSKLRAKPMAANASSIRGATSIFCVFDEMAHMQEGESKATAEQCYEAAKPALRQFGKAGMMFLNSSPWSKVGKFHDRMEDAMSLDDDGSPSYDDIFAFQAPSWELYRDFHLDAKKRFSHALMVDPDATDEECEAAADPVEMFERRRKARLDEKANPQTFAVEYRSQWAEVQDAYFDRFAVDRAFTGSIRYYDPETEQDVIVSAKPQEGGTYMHVFSGHVDPSSTTAGFGFALGHVESYPDRDFPGETVDHVVFDVVKRWDPADFPGHTIRYETVIDELVDYCKLFSPKVITHDQYMGTLFGQSLRKALRQAGAHETRVRESTGQEKKNFDEWELLKTALNLNLVHIHPSLEHADWVKDELKFLREVRVGKVDKQTTGPVTTKDVADCVRSTVFELIGAKTLDLLGREFQSQGLVGGSEGGYQIGGATRANQGGSIVDNFYGQKGGGMSVARGIARNRRRKGY